MYSVLVHDDEFADATLMIVTVMLQVCMIKNADDNYVNIHWESYDESE